MVAEDQVGYRAIDVECAIDIQKALVFVAVGSGGGTLPHLPSLDKSNSQL